jgi:hypothetical protein
MNICLCLICLKPNDIWIEFLSKITGYDIYIIIDDNTMIYNDKYSQYKNIKFIQIEDKDCIDGYFFDMSYGMSKCITGWDKAVYYFSVINTNYNHVWFFEDDVFFYDETTIKNIDQKYCDSDLLTNHYEENLTGTLEGWYHWYRLNIAVPPPHYHAMCCAVRMSNLLLSKIKEYAITYKKLFYLEALFPTICKHHKLIYDFPDELKNIVYSNTYEISDIDKLNIYHPIKDINVHKLYRNEM